ncbi:MAG: hypothetical protein L0331_33520, partial [Chloroflexi bacterium]|nr:hypothetical protein [Chloroflexota bacterium]
KKKDIVNHCLQWVKENFKVSDNGSTISFPFDIAYIVVKETIDSYVCFQDPLPEATRRKIISLGLRRWVKYKKYQNQSNVIISFIQALDVETRRLQKEFNIFQVWMFLNMDRRQLSTLEPIKILGDNIKVKQWNEIPKPDLLNKIWSEDHSNPILQDTDQPLWNRSKFIPVVLDVKASDHEAAADIASDRLDILRGALNFSKLCGVFSLFRQTPKPLSVILPSPVYAVFTTKNELVSVYYTIEKFDYQRADFQNDKLVDAAGLLSLFGKDLRYPDTYYFILKLVQLYQNTLDISSPQHAYLAMWQVFEVALSLEEEQVSQGALISRTKIAVKLDSLFQDALELLVKHRNELVHTGIFPERGDYILFTLKVIVDSCMNSLIKLAKHFSTVHELREYFSFASLGDMDLARKKGTISTIEGFRQKATRR